MRFDKEGKALETHVEYSAAVWEIGKAYNTPVIDLDLRSRNLLQQSVLEYSKMFFMQLDSLQHPNYPNALRERLPDEVRSKAKPLCRSRAGAVIGALKQDGTAASTAQKQRALEQMAVVLAIWAKRHRKESISSPFF